MLQPRTLSGIVSATLLSLAVVLGAQTTQPSPTTAPDLSRDRTLYVVGYAHLDTQWRWSYPQVVREFLRNTLRMNFERFEKFPNYVFNFTGSYRYELMREYFPSDYARMKSYIAAGRWFPAGSSVDECDALIPSPESLIRHVLYGNQYFRREFGVASEEFMLPDSFGFPQTLPTILAHCGLRGFSTQKLTWGSAIGVPFNIGEWKGPDGRGVIAAFNPGSYSEGAKENLAASKTWSKRIEENGEKTGLFADYKYVGTGDRGGATTEEALKFVEQSVAAKEGVRVISAAADALFKAVTPERRAKLPVYRGELLLTKHSAGVQTSQAFMKRMNRKNEHLADAAERASVAAWWLGGAAYPTAKLHEAWVGMLASQMHDMLPGTCLPKAYEYAWNNELLANNRFAAVEANAIGAIVSGMNTHVRGVPLAVYNATAYQRRGVIEAVVRFPGEVPTAIRVFDSTNNDTPAQVVGNDKDGLHILFSATAPPNGVAIYTVQSAPAAMTERSLRVSESSLENDTYRVTLDANGDVASIYDKASKREMLSAPARLALLHENPGQYPSWNMDWADRQKPPRGYVGGLARVRVVERGPARVGLEITRETDGSTFVQTIRLGIDSNLVEFDTRVDWRTRESSLKAVFPLTVSNPQATYDTGLGSIRRGNNDEKRYEVPTREWMNLASPDDSYSVTILNECKYGADKPDDQTLRLTLLYTPGTRGGYQDQGTQDFGRHEMKYAIVGNSGGWRELSPQYASARLNQPLRAFQTPQHEGALGRTFSFVELIGPSVHVLALKKAEESDAIIVRLAEPDMTDSGVQVKFAGKVVSAEEVDGQERRIGNAEIYQGRLIANLRRNEVRSYAVKLSPPETPLASPACKTVKLPFDSDVISTNANRADGGFDADGRTLPAEQFPGDLVSEDIGFHLGSPADGEKNAVACRGQTIDLPAGAFDRVYLLAAASEGDRRATFRVGDTSTTLTIQDWGGYIGQWDTRLWRGEIPELTYTWRNKLDGVARGYVRPAIVAWRSTHRHHPVGGDEFYQSSYLFKYALDVPAGAMQLVLPNDEGVKVLAVTVARQTHDSTTPALPLGETLPPAEDQFVHFSPAPRTFVDATSVHILPPLYGKFTGMRFTLDGTDPTPQSPTYDEPIALAAKTTVRAAMFDPAGKRGPIAEAMYDVDDHTSPTIEAAGAVATTPMAWVRFSEPLDVESAKAVGYYRLGDHRLVSAAVRADGRTVDLTLADDFKVGDALAIDVDGVRDRSPAGNAIANGHVDAAIASPIFSRAEIADKDRGLSIRVPGLPLGASAAWTINCLVWVDAQPEDRTILFGFGTCEDEKTGCGRYLAKFSTGVHFWSRGADVTSRQALALGRWQMLTATYDGARLTLYQDGKVIGEDDGELAKDPDAVVRIAPIDPWDKTRQFSGRLRDATIWNVALSADDLAAIAGKFNASPR